MKIHKKTDFQHTIRQLNIDTEYVIIKPNWVCNQIGRYTDATLLEWLFEVLPQKKILIESYTPWRGLEYTSGENDCLETDLEKGKNYWDFYKQQDQNFLKETQIDQVMKKNEVEYLNITNEVWDNKCVNPDLIEREFIKKYKSIFWKELFSYIPRELYDKKNKATFISFSKIKTENSLKKIFVSGVIKNLFGLIPHPSRYQPFHGMNHEMVHQSIVDIFCLYDSLFAKKVWISEGIHSIVRNNVCDNEYIEKDKALFFSGTDPIEVDSAICGYYNINANDIEYLNLIKRNIK